MRLHASYMHLLSLNCITSHGSLSIYFLYFGRQYNLLTESLKFESPIVQKVKWSKLEFVHQSPTTAVL